MTTTRRGPYKKGLRRREDILDHALEVFIERGNANMSLRAVAQELGVTHAAVQHYFDSLEELLLEVVERRDAHNRRLSEEMHAETLHEQLVLGARENTSTPGLTALFTSMLAASVEPQNELSRAYFTKRFEQGRADLQASIEAGREDGKVPDGPDARAISALIMAAFDGLQIQWLLDPTIDMATTLALLDPLIGNAAATPAHSGDVATGETGNMSPSP